MLDPGLHQRDVFEAGQAADLSVDPTGRRAPFDVAEEMLRHETGVVGRGDAAADRRPEAVDEHARDPRCARSRKAPLGVLEVKGEVTGFVAHDAAEEVRQHGVIGAIGELLVAGERRELVIAPHVMWTATKSDHMPATSAVAADSICWATVRRARPRSAVG